MLPELKVAKAYSWDLDGIVIGRERITNELSAFKDKIKTSSELPFSFKDAPPLARSIGEAISFSLSSRRKVVPQVRDVLEKVTKDGFDNFGNTGRLNKQKWHDITESTLTKGGVRDYFKQIFYTDPRMSTAVSKANAIRELQRSYGQIRHVDDDPKTAFYLATLFPDVAVYLLQYGFTGTLYSKEERDKFPNLRRIAILQEISRSN